ncbi:zinc phosphodiesterase-like protein, partial [Euroglyphus maynei]
MFNCGEGLQRLIGDFGFKPSKIETFFSTSNRWHNFSGISALLLARYDSGSRHFTINNTNDLNRNLFQNCTVFDTKLKRLKYNFIDENHFVHEKLSIRIVPIVFGGLKTAVYLGNLSAQKGEINLEKCFYQKVPRNLVNDLEQNRSVQSHDGRTIHRSDVSDPDSPEQNFIIFECIDKNYLQHLSVNEMIEEFIPKCEVIVHFTKDAYLREQSYDEFFQKYHSSHHLLITESNPSFSLHSNYRYQLQLNQLDPHLFPCLRNNEKSSNSNDKNIIYSPTGIKYIFRSSTTSEISVINMENVPQFPTITDALQHKDGSERDGIEESIQQLQEKQSSLLSLNDKNFPEFLFLGTASSHPLPIRNVSGILVNIDGEKSILFDCGENTYGQ